MNTSLFDRKLLNDSKEEEAGKRMVDVTKLGAVEKHMFIDELLKEIEEDNLQLLKKQKERIDRYKQYSSFYSIFLFTTYCSTYMLTTFSRMHSATRICMKNHFFSQKQKYKIKNKILQIELV